MKRYLKKILVGLGIAFMAIAMIGCSNPSSPSNPNDSSNSSNPSDSSSSSNPSDSSTQVPENEGDTVIMSEPSTITWSVFCTIPAGKFTGDSVRSIQINFDNVDTGDEGYVAMKIAAAFSDSPLGKGTIVGGSLKKDDLGAIEGIGNPNENEKTIIYTPTSDEWNAIKSTGLYINGNNVKIRQVILK